MAARVNKALLTLDAVSDAPITLLINSKGGDMEDGWAIYDTVRACRSEITTKVVGCAMSMGAIILQAGDRRVATPNASIMLHYGYSGDGLDRIQTKYSEQAYNRVLLKRMEDLLTLRIREKQPKCSSAIIKKWLSDDKYFTAQSALKYGLIDSVLL